MGSEQYEKCKPYIKKYYDNNKQEILNQKKKHYEENKEKIREYHKKYYQLNKNKLIEQSKEYKKNKKIEGNNMDIMDVLQNK